MWLHREAVTGHPKFHRPWHGPYVILEALPPLNYRLRRLGAETGRTMIVHHNRLKPHFPSRLQETLCSQESDFSDDPGNEAVTERPEHRPVSDTEEVFGFDSDFESDSGWVKVRIKGGPCARDISACDSDSSTEPMVSSGSRTPGTDCVTHPDRLPDAVPGTSRNPIRCPNFPSRIPRPKIFERSPYRLRGRRPTNSQETLD